MNSQLTDCVLARWFEAIGRDDSLCVAEMLCEYGTPLLLAGQVLQDGHAYAPLHVAAHHGAIGVLKILLEKGANPNENLRVARAEQVFVADISGLPKVPITPLDWAAQAGHENAVCQLLEKGADPNGANPASARGAGIDGMPDPISFPLSRALRIIQGQRAKALQLVSHRICTRLLIAGADPNRIMTCSRWRGTPLAFAWRVLGSKDASFLLLHHGAELFTDDLLSCPGAIRPDCGKSSLALSRNVIKGLLDINKRYSWGVALSAFAIYSDAEEHRREHIRWFLEAGADPTLVFNHTLFELQPLPQDQTKLVHLDALAALLSQMDDVDRKWPSGHTLWDAWEDACPHTSLSRGQMLFTRARHGKELVPMPLLEPDLLE